MLCMALLSRPISSPRSRYSAGTSRETSPPATSSKVADRGGQRSRDAAGNHYAKKRGERQRDERKHRDRNR